MRKSECGIVWRAELRTTLNLCVGAVAPSPPSEGFGFRAPPVADAARRQAAAVRKCKANAEARAVNGEGATVARRIKDENAVTEGEIH